MLRTFDDLFRVFGGPANVGRAIGKSTEHVASMRRRNSIPLRYWPALIAEAERRGIPGVNMESLGRMALCPVTASAPHPAQERTAP